MDDNKDYDFFLELAKKRRSVRQFKPDPVPDEHVTRIIEAALWSPSGFNSQPWEFIVVKEPTLKDKIVQLVTEYRGNLGTRLEATRESWMVSQPSPGPENKNDWRAAPVFILLCGDTRTKVGLPMTVRYEYAKYQSIFTSSLANAFVYMQLAATALGLTSCYVSPVKSAFLYPLVRDILGIPREFEVYDMLALGYPDAESKPKLMRDKKMMVHYDYCVEEDFRTDEEVNDFIIKTRTRVNTALD